MLFDTRTVLVMNRYVVRKGFEIAMVTADTGISEAERHLRIDRLMIQMSKARIIAAIGYDDLTDIPLNMHIIGAPVPEVPPRMLSEYLSSIGERDREDETLFETSNTALDGLVHHFRAAVAIYESGDPTCGIDDTDMILHRRALYDPGEMDGDILRTLLRIGSLKYVPNETMSPMIGRMVDDPRWAGSVPILLARCIMNCNTPALAGLSDSPLSGQIRDRSARAPSTQ